jgi:acylphosphatase
MHQATEITLTGDLSAASLAPWVRHRAELLDLRGWMEQSGPGAARIVVVGAEAMIEAMEISCSLGPADVMVATLSTRPRQLAEAPLGFKLQ